MTTESKSEQQPSPATWPPLLTTKEACQYLRVSDVTLWKWRKKRLLKGTKLSGGVMRYKLSELQRLVDSKTRHND